MNELALIVVPLLLAGLAFFWPQERTRPWLLPVAGGLHVASSWWLLAFPSESMPGAWFGFDPVARAVLPMISLLFLVCSLYAVAYLKLRPERHNRLCIPHAWLSDLLTAASLHLNAFMRRSVFQEFNVTSGPLSRELCKNPIQLEDGFLRVPQGPGLGVEVDEAAIEKYRVE